MILISFLTTRDSLLHKSIFVFSSLTSIKDQDGLKFDISPESLLPEYKLVEAILLNQLFLFLQQ